MKTGDLALKVLDRYESLLVIFNPILNTDIFPDEMKLAKIIPIYKSGKKKNRLRKL